MAKCKNCKYLDTVQNDLRSEPFKWCVCTDDSPVLDMERDCENYAPMTNADRIRNMTDEELAETIPCPHMVNWKKGNYDTCVHPNGKDGCKKCILEWLRSEIE